VQTGLVKASPRLVRGRNGTIGFSAFGQPAEPLRALRAANLCVNRGVVVSRPNNPPPPNKRRATYLDAPQTPRRAGFSACTPRSPPCRSTKITCKSHDMFQKIFQKFSRKYFCENIFSGNISAKAFPRKLFLWKCFLGKYFCQNISSGNVLAKVFSRECLLGNIFQESLFRKVFPRKYFFQRAFARNISCDKSHKDRGNPNTQRGWDLFWAKDMCHEV